MAQDDLTIANAPAGGPKRVPDLGAKVPAAITVYFWVIKILTTAMGEATSDFLALRFNHLVAGVAGAAGLALALALQLRRRQYFAWNYWFTVAMVAVFGTMLADGLHLELHLPYVASTIFYAIVLTVVLVAWYRTEGTIAIHSISTPRRELFYWATVLATFALGTAAGDLTATTFHLGYFSSGLLFSAAFLVPGLAYWLFRIDSVVAFWVAYILTRPFGASFADWMGVPRRLGGLDFGRGPVALIMLAPILVLVAYLAITRKDAAVRPRPAHIRR